MGKIYFYICKVKSNCFKKLKVNIKVDVRFYDLNKWCGMDLEIIEEIEKYLD